MALDKSKVRLREYDLYTESLGRVGYLVSAQTQTSPGSEYIVVENAAQTRGIVKGWKVGDKPTLTAQLLQVDFEALFGGMGGGQYPEIVDSTTGNKSWGMGDKVIDLDNIGEFVRLHPTDADADDFTQDIAFWKAAPDFSQVTISGNRDEAQTVTVPFRIFADENKSADERFGRVGDWTAVEGTPLGVFIQVGKTQYPYVHTVETELARAGVKTPLVANIFNGALSGTTCTIDEVGGITATQTLVDVDAVTNTALFAVGDYVQINSAEVAEIIGATVTGANSKQLTLLRGVGGTTAAIAADNDTIEILSNVSVSRGTEKATWASSDGTKATVGNSNASSNKGIVTAVATGFANITATVNAKASPNFAVTVS